MATIVFVGVCLVVAALIGMAITISLFLLRDRNLIINTMSNTREANESIRGSINRIEDKIDNHNKFASRLVVLESERRD